MNGDDDMNIKRA